MMTIALAARQYPANNSDNPWGDYLALVRVSVRAHHPVYVDKIVESSNWMLISSAGKPPKMLSEEEALVAKANTFWSNSGLCSAIESSDAN